MGKEETAPTKGSIEEHLDVFLSEDCYGVLLVIIIMAFVSMNTTNNRIVQTNVQRAHLPSLYQLRDHVRTCLATASTVATRQATPLAAKF